MGCIKLRVGAMVGHSRAVPPLALIDAPPTTVSNTMLNHKSDVGYTIPNVQQSI